MSISKIIKNPCFKVKYGGERGIRTLVPDYSGSCLAGKRFRPLSHLSINNSQRYQKDKGILQFLQALVAFIRI